MARPSLAARIYRTRVRWSSALVATVALFAAGLVANPAAADPTVSNPPGLDTVPQQMQAIAFTSDGSKAFVVDSYSGVYAINAQTNTTSAAVLSEYGGKSVAIVGNSVYVDFEYQGLVKVVNATTGALTTSVTVGSLPQAMVEDDTNVYVANTSSNSISVIKAANNTVIATIALPASPGQLAVDATKHRLYVVCGQDIYVIDTATNTLLTGAGLPIATTSAHYGANLSPDGKFLYLTDWATNSVSIVNTTSYQVNPPATRFPVALDAGALPIGSVISPDGSYLYVRYSGQQKIVAVNLRTRAVDYEFANSTMSSGMAFTPNGKKLYIPKDIQGVSVITASVSDAPTDATGTPGPESATLTWMTPAKTGGAAVTGYRVKVATNPSGPWSDAEGDCAADVTRTSTTTSCTATGLTAGTPYYFEVFALNMMGASVPVVSQAVTPEGSAKLSFTITDTTQDTISGQISGVTPGQPQRTFEVRIDGDTTGTWTRLNVDPVMGFIIDGLNSETTYQLVIREKTARGWGTPSEPVRARTTAWADCLLVILIILSVLALLVVLFWTALFIIKKKSKNADTTVSLSETRIDARGSTRGDIPRSRLKWDRKTGEVSVLPIGPSGTKLTITVREVPRKGPIAGRVKVWKRTWTIA